MGVSRLISFVFVLGLFFLVQYAEIVNGEKRSEHFGIDPINQGGHLSFVRNVRNSPNYYSNNYNSDESENSENSEASGSSEECGGDDGSGRKLLVFILDGYRWDYYENNKEVLPTFTEMMEEGVTSEWVNPVYPTSSSPNWQTINSGLTVDHHGIYSNEEMRCEYGAKPTVAELLDYNDTKNDVWWQVAEPVWATAVKQGKTAYCYRWARCDVPYQGISASEDSTGYPDFSFPVLFQDFVDGMDKVKEHVQKGTDLMMVHVDFTDGAGHFYGPDDPGMTQSLADVDAVFGEFRTWLKTQSCTVQKQLDIVFVSDHGMTPFGRNNSDTQYVVFEQFFSPENVLNYLWSSAFAFFLPAEGKTDQLMEELSKLPGVDCYRREDIPERLGLKHGPLMLPVLCVCPPHVGLIEADSVPRQGQHGWNAQDDHDQRAFFMAVGPSFKRDVIIKPIDMQDVHQVFLKSLGLPLIKTDGNFEHVKDIFA